MEYAYTDFAFDEEEQRWQKTLLIEEKPFTKTHDGPQREFRD